MPRVTLSFNLPEEQDEFNLAVDGARIASALDELDDYLRRIIKYKESLPEDHRAIYIKIRETLQSLKSKE